MCTGFPPTTFCNQCMECRLLGVRNLYERERLSKLKKKRVRNGTQKTLEKIKKDWRVQTMWWRHKWEWPKSRSKLYEATPVKRRKPLTQKVGVKKYQKEKKNKIRVVMIVKKN